MTKENEKILREIIKKVELESPSKDFVKNVMNECYEVEIELSNYDLLKIWFRKSLPYVATILVFVITSATLYFSGISLQPEIISNFFNSIGLEFLNTLSVLRLTTVGLIFGLVASLMVFYNKVKKQRLENQVL